MADQHRATLQQWRDVKEHNYLAFSCLLELRDRIEALEATQSGSIDLSHLSDAEREKILKLLANPGTFEVLEVAQPAKSNHPENPGGSLMTRVEDAIYKSCTTSHGFREEARAAIREVAAWLREQEGYGHGWAIRLEQEAEQ